jgi:ferritin
VKEQTEEENLVISLLDKIKIAGSEKATIDTLYFLNIDLANTLDDGRLAQKVTIENPQKI